MTDDPYASSPLLSNNMRSAFILSMLSDLRNKVETYTDSTGARLKYQDIYLLTILRSELTKNSYEIPIKRAEFVKLAVDCEKMSLDNWLDYIRCK